MRGYEIPEGMEAKMHEEQLRLVARVLALVGVFALVTAGCAWTTIASTNSANQVVTGVGGSEIALSANGRYAAFIARDLIADGDDTRQVYVKDLVSGIVQRVSTSSAGVTDNGYPAGPSMSDDGRYVAWASSGANLVAGDTNLAIDVFLKDRQTGQTTRVSTASDGTQANSFSAAAGGLSMSGDGHFVAFESAATNLVAGPVRWSV